MKILAGKVVSDKMDKGIVVEIIRIKKHPLYDKRYQVSKKYQVHDEKNEAKIGQKVVIEPSRPVSKCKAYRLVKILEQK